MNGGKNEGTEVEEGGRHQRMLPGSSGVTRISTGLMLATPTQLLSF